jgi:predicted outer membrane repeat protein
LAANLILNDVTIANNASLNPEGGGGLFNDGGAVLTNVTVSGNSASHGGGIASNFRPPDMGLISSVFSRGFLKADRRRK